MIVKPVSPAEGEFRDNVFLYPIRVYYEDTDAGGIVYYANYLKFAERARTEFIRTLGCRQQEALECEERCGFVVRTCDIEYLMPAVLDDELTVASRVSEQTGVTISMHQDIMRGDHTLVSIDIKLVHMSLSAKKPTRIPKDLALKIEQYL